ncbi:MAG TPA: glycosyltransferase [Acidisphaera sp.]|nr:glycosyltransferase [Acidisphaera sp.]
MAGAFAGGGGPAPAIPAAPRALRQRLHRASESAALQNRPHCLERALRSLAAAAQSDAHPGLAHDVLVVDNASGDKKARTYLDSLASDARGGGAACRLRLLRLEQPVLQAAAYNLAAEQASGEALVFLDDDNVFAPGGLSRLLHALSAGAFDLVVTCLDLHDGDPEQGRASARLLFLGDAGSAGLFFNGFGDTAMAVRRDDFLRLGGFEASASGPALDWEFLAKARAAGLRIGVVQEPAIRYAREIGDGDRKWRKRDQEVRRNSVLRAYGDAFDHVLVARLAQDELLSRY